MAIYPNRATDGFIDALCGAVADFPPDVVRAAVDRFIAGQVPEHDNRYVVNGAELVEQCRLMERMLRPTTPTRDLIAVPIGQPYPDGYVPLGPTDVDYGHGPIRMGHLHPRQKAVVERLRGRTRDGRNMATMTAAELDAETTAVLRLPAPERAKMLEAS